MFRGVEVGVWYRIQVEGRSIFAKILERGRKVCTIRYLDDDGHVVTAEVSRSDVRGRLGDHYVSSLEAAIADSESQEKTRSSLGAGIRPGDWHRFEHDREIFAGVVYRIEGDQYTLFFLYDGIPTFTTLPFSCIGPQEERLTERFRREMARNPNHLEEWISKAGKFSAPPAKAATPTVVGRQPGRQSPGAQKRLFPK